jgi:hypothetical protein
MKLLPLYDLQQEINRLFVAGSKFAKDDPRLQKQAAVFNKLGEKSPVFKKIAEGIESLVKAESSDSPGILLEISTLLYAVLYTQGETVDTEQQESELIPAIPLKYVYTNKSYLALRSLIETLSLQKEGRLLYSSMRAAFENGQFNDFRIYHLYDAALSDYHTEFADYIETTVIPAIGTPMIPFILKNFNCEGSLDDIRRFRILRRLGYSKIPEMVNEILAGKSVFLQAEVVKTLSSDPKNEELLIKLAGDKQKPIRLAAYEALANLNTEMAQRTLVELFVSSRKKSDAAELGEVLKINLSDKFVPALLEKAKDNYKQCLELDKSANLKVINKAFESLMISLKPLVNNINEDILTFYKEMFTSKEYNELLKIAELKTHLPGWIAASVAKELENTEEGLDCLKFLSENSPYNEFVCSCFRVSVKNKTDKKSLYDRFAKYIDQLLKGNVFTEVFFDKTGKPNSNMDERWKELHAHTLSKNKNISG